MELLKRIYRVKGEVVARRLAGEELLVPVRGRLADLQRIFALDPVAAHIWKHVDGKQDGEAILKSVVETFEVDESTARVDLERFLGQLAEAGLVEC